jgi:glycosyltransferase involved in cell wall biosynthesis
MDKVFQNYKPIITIIIATYNEQNNIVRTLSSIQEQKYRDIEVIVVDGASTDETVGILKENQDIINKWISEKDSGIYDAWNKALKLCSGEWIMFLGAGDYLNPSAVEKYVNCINNSESDINFVSANGVIVRDNGKIVSKVGQSFQKQRFLKYMTICHPSALHHKSLFEEFGSFDSSYHISADYAFLLRSLNSINAAYIDKVLVTILDEGVSAYSFDCLHETRKAKLPYRKRWLVEWEWMLSIIKLYLKLRFFKIRNRINNLCL